MKQEQREYLLGLTLGRLMGHIRREYGVQPDFAVHAVEKPNRELHVVASVQLHNFVEAAEYGRPEPVILVRRLSAILSTELLLKEALVRLVERMEAAAE